MSFCSIMNLEEELDEISHIIDKKLDKSAKEIYVVNSILSERDNMNLKYHNKKFHFVQFLPHQSSYKNIDKETDGFITKKVNISISNSITNYCFNTNSTQRFYYKIKN